MGLFDVILPGATQPSTIVRLYRLSSRIVNGRFLAAIRSPLLPSMPDILKQKRVKWLRIAVQGVLLALLAWGVRRYLSTALSDLDSYDWKLRPGWLILSAVLYLVGLLPCAWFWRRILRHFHQQPRSMDVVRAYFIGNLGKYVPGKAMVVVLRAGILREKQVDTTVAAVTVFYETLTMMAVGAAIAALLVAILWSDQTMAIVAAVGLMIVSVTPTLPPVFRRLARLAGLGRTDPRVAGRLADFGYGELMTGWMVIAAGWFSLGLSLWAVLRGIGLDDVPLLETWPLCTAAVALAVVAGFLSLVPGGAGVRESILLPLLAPRLGATVAVGAAILLRVVWLVAELIISAILFLGGKRSDVRIAPQEQDALDD